MEADNTIIQQTRAWISSVVIGCNFCPFAAKVLKQEGIHFRVVHSNNMATCLQAFAEEVKRLDQHTNIETTLVILPGAFADFYPYLHLVKRSEKWLSGQGYEGTYQLASFHPRYLFSGAHAHDPANYTNRSMYPMLHILRESAVTRALENFTHPESIPQRNIDFATQKGLAYMQQLRESCW